MNLQNLMSQLGNATNPIQMMMSMLSPTQKQTIDLFKNKPNQEQANEIAQKCNELGISKQDLEQIVGLLKRR